MDGTFPRRPKGFSVFRRCPRIAESRGAKLFCSLKSDFDFGQYAFRPSRAPRIFKTSVAQAWERCRKIAFERFVLFLSSGGAFGDRSRAISRLGQKAFRCWVIFESTQNIGGHSVLILHPPTACGPQPLDFLKRYPHRVKKTPFEPERYGHRVGTPFSLKEIFKI